MCGAVVSAAGDPCVFGSDGGFVASGDDPLGIFGAKQDVGALGGHPADGCLGACLHFEEEGGGVEVARCEVVEVVRAGAPDCLRLGGCGGEEETGFVEAGKAWVACGCAEGLQAPIIGFYGAREGDGDGGDVFEVSDGKALKDDVFLVGVDDEFVVALVVRPSGLWFVGVDVFYFGYE